MSNVVTDGIRIQVRTTYVPERSDPEREHFFFAYTVRIANEGGDPARLLGRSGSRAASCTA